LAAHVEALAANASASLVDIVLANNHVVGGPGSAADPAGRRAAGTDGRSSGAVKLRWPPAVDPVPRLIVDDVVDPLEPHHHDPARLALAIVRALDGETGIRRRTTGRSATRTA